MQELGRRRKRKLDPHVKYVGNARKGKEEGIPRAHAQCVGSA